MIQDDFDKLRSELRAILDAPVSEEEKRKNVEWFGIDAIRLAANWRHSERNASAPGEPAISPDAINPDIDPLGR